MAEPWHPGAVSRCRLRLAVIPRAAILGPSLGPVAFEATAISLNVFQAKGDGDPEQAMP